MYNNVPFKVTLALSLPAGLVTTHWYIPPLLASLLFNCNWDVKLIDCPDLMYVQLYLLLRPPLDIHSNSTGLVGSEFKVVGVASTLVSGDTK